MEAGLEILKKWTIKTRSPPKKVLERRSSARRPADVHIEGVKMAEATRHDNESPSTSQSDTPKETESPRFQALLQLTGGPQKKKLRNEIRSYSHELDPKGVRSHDYWRSHSFNDLEKILGALRSKFNTAKEEVNAELEVLAGDLVEILEKNATQPRAWQEKTEDLLVLARQCALMQATDFRKHCESIVQELDDKRQDLPVGILKQLHMRMLFILTRCTRLLQFQKENGLDEDIFSHKSHQLTKVVPYADRTWMSMELKKGKGKGMIMDLPPKGEIKKSISSPPVVLQDSLKPSVTERENVEPLVDTLQFLKPFLDTSKTFTIRQEKNFGNGVDLIIADRLASWRKFKESSEDRSQSVAESVRSVAESVQSDNGDGKIKNRKTKRDLQVCLDRENGGVLDNSFKESGSLSAPAKPSSLHRHRVSWGYWGDQPNVVDDTCPVICRICEEEVPTLCLEEHSRVCAFADRSDLKSLGVNERLWRLAETLEKMVETYIPKRAGSSPDSSRVLEVPELTAEKANSLLRKASEDMLDDLHEIDAASIDEPKGFTPMTCRTRFGPKSDGGIASASGGSVTSHSPLNTPKTNPIENWLPDRSSLVEPGDPVQMNELADVARCVANTNPGDDGALEYIISCMQDLQDVLQHNKVVALTIDTFGKRIDKLLKEKYQQISGSVEQHSPEASSNEEDDGITSLKSTPVHPAVYKDRTTIDDFEIIKPISRGAFGRVFLARKRTTGDLFAIKVLRKADMIRKNAVESVQAERNILISVRNPFVVRFFYSFTCRDNLYLVMEYLNGGDVYSMLRSLGCLEEEMAQVYIAELVLALEYLHSLGVVHRDLKPDNLLIAHDGHIKLTDFGLSRVGLINSTDDLTGPAVSSTALMEETQQAAEEHERQRARRQQQTAVGTPDYLAPEILLGTGHGATADWWSTGIILFECLTGIPPFNAEHPQIIFDKILNRNIPWPNVPEEMSFEAKDLIDKLLKEDPNERLGAKGAAEVKAHPFFKNINWDTLARQKAAFVPSPDTAHDTSYFTSRHMWNSSERRVFPDQDFGDSSDYDSSSSASSASLETRPEEHGDEFHDLAEFEVAPSAKYSFSNFSFKNLSQLASINYDLLLQTGKDSPKGPS